MYGAFRSGHTCEPENRTDRRKVPHGKGSTERYMKIRRIIGRFAPVSAHCGRRRKETTMKKEHTKLKEAALKYHSEGRPGKLEVIPIKPFGSQRDLSLAYSPGSSLSVPRNREEPRGRIQIYLEDQSGGRHLQRNGSTRSGRHRSAGRQTRHGRKRTAFQNIRRHRRFRHRGGYARRGRIHPDGQEHLLPPSAASTWRISKPRSVSSSKSGCAANSTSP